MNKTLALADRPFFPVTIGKARKFCPGSHDNSFISSVGSSGDLSDRG